MSEIVPFPNGRISSQLQAVAARLRQFYPQISQGKFNLWEMVHIAALCSILPGLWYLKARKENKPISSTRSEGSINDGTTNGSVVTIRKNIDINGQPLLLLSVRSVADSYRAAEDEVIDPGLLRKHSVFRSYTTSRFNYPSLRIFFQRRMCTSPFWDFESVGSGSKCRSENRKAAALFSFRMLT
jgi:hypothetical protein